MACDVFQYDNGVIHHKARSNGQSHQAQVIQAVIAQVHDAERTNQRHGDNNARNQRGPTALKKKKDRQNNQSDRQNERSFHFLE